MPYLLQHHFDPDFDHTRLSPSEQNKGRLDYRNLNYVQNVVAGQILAELREIRTEETGQYDPRFILKAPALPVGPNTQVDPANPLQLLSLVNGYVFYFNSRIAVKELLNIRGDVDSLTGNVYFVGDMIVHGSVKSGYEVQAHHIRVKEMVESAIVRAGGTLEVQGGVTGGRKARLSAEKDIRLGFCENATAAAKSNLIVLGSCLHSSLFAGGNLLVKKRLHGGVTHCRNQVMVVEQLGGGSHTPTSLVIGYDPFLMLKMKDIETSLEKLEAQVQRTDTARDVHDPTAEEQRRVILEEKIAALKRQQVKVMEEVQAANLNEARVIVPGLVREGVEVSIGQAHYEVVNAMTGVVFRYRDSEVVVEPYVARPAGSPDGAGKPS